MTRARLWKWIATFFGLAAAGGAIAHVAQRRALASGGTARPIATSPVGRLVSDGSPLALAPAPLVEAVGRYGFDPEALAPWAG